MPEVLGTASQPNEIEKSIDQQLSSESRTQVLACLKSIQEKGIPVSEGMRSRAKYAYLIMQTARDILDPHLRSELESFPRLPDLQSFRRDQRSGIENNIDWSYLTYKARVFANATGIFIKSSTLTPQQIDDLHEWYDDYNAKSKNTILAICGYDRDQDVSPAGIERSAIEAACEELCKLANAAESEEQAVVQISNLVSFLTRLTEQQDIAKNLQSCHASSTHLQELMNKSQAQQWYQVIYLIRSNSQALSIFLPDLSVPGSWPLDAKEAYAQLLYYSPEEIAQLRARNLAAVSEHIVHRARMLNEPLTIEDLVKLHQITLKDLLPDKMLGVRTGGIHVGKHSAPSVDLVIPQLEVLVSQANRLIASRTAQGDFLIELAGILLEYSRIHPNVDGNGTTEVCFGELIAQLHGLKPADITNPDYVLRLRSLFRNSGRAILRFVDTQQDRIGKSKDGERLRTIATPRVLLLIRQLFAGLHSAAKSL